MIEKLTDDTRKEGIFLKTAQNAKYAKDIKNFVTPKEVLSKLDGVKFIGITGTNGKTTTAFVLSYILNKLGFNVATQGTEGFFYNLKKKEPKTLTTPPILTTIKRAFKYKPDFFIMEVSSHAIAQNRIEGINFFAKILTSFSQDHLDYHKSIEEYKKIKESFFQDSAIKVVCDNKEALSRFNFNYNLQNLYKIKEPLINDIKMAGWFNLCNFSLAIKLASIITSEDIEKIKNIAREFEGVRGRMEVINKEPLIIVDFAHTPDGIKKVLNSIDGKKVVVFGAGGDRDKDKRKLMGEAANLADYVIITNDNPRCEDEVEIAKEIAKGVKKPYEIILNRKEAIKRGIDIAKSGYSLLVLGKGDEEFIEYCNKKIPFSDRKVIKECLKS